MSPTETLGIALASLLMLAAIIHDVRAYFEAKRRADLIEQIRARFRAGQPPYINRRGRLIRHVRRPVHRKRL